jgi:Tol biopolymer transport system component
MPLAPGTQLGPYEILAPLGEGGMGEVYRARDTRLERTVAVKILPEQFSSDPIRKQRFEREAKTISKLNHPHICVLYDVGHQEGTDYLVMECVEGETLASRLAKGPLPLEHVLKFGMQTADALDKAHRSGVVHRDLKPGNIMLTATGIKLLDFGLAKPSAALATAATLTAGAKQQSPMTEEGSVVGTFQYMSPEQVEGKELDGRSDLFSLGAVLYEMLTGKRAFEGKSQLSVASAILEKEPEPLSKIKPLTPPAFDHAIRRCLAKDPEGRWQAARDLSLELKWISEGGAQAGERATMGRTNWARAGWIVSAALFLLLMASGTMWWRASHVRAPAMYFYSPLPFAANDVALSPDGKTLAMVAYSPQANTYALWTYEVGGRKAAPLEGTAGASYPFWSPDGKFIGFFADGKLKKIEVSTAQIQALCDAPNGRGGAWNREGIILFTPDALRVGLLRVSAQGGTPVEETRPDEKLFETSHRWPVFLPDGNHYLYLAANFSGRFENNAIYVGSLDAKERRRIVNASANAAYAEPGFLLYMRDNAIVAQPFDARSFALIGDPHAVSEEVLYFPGVDRAIFSVASNGVLVTQTGKGASLSQLTWFDRGGKPMGTVGPPATFDNVRLSPDGTRVATDQPDATGRNIDIWVYDRGRGAATRLTFDPALDQTPNWSPNGKQILFASNRNLGFDLYTKNADGSGADQNVASLGEVLQLATWDWSRDGKYMLVRKNNELWSVKWPEREVQPLLQPKWSIRNAQFSPDGKWFAYAANESGIWEIYVSPFPGGSGKWQVSNAGGQEPKWRHDGKELFYISPDGKLTAVGIKLGSSVEANLPVALFQTHRRQPVSAQDLFSYDVSADGQRFLIATKVDEPSAAPLTVQLNWAAKLEK